MALLIVGAIAAGVAMMANNNEDSPVLWGIITFIAGIAGAFVFGFLGALIGSILGAGLYIGKTLRFG
ncbi:GlsB/YeaQ/YmgE family stress response membrane protein [Aureliella helgolandensis]|uniref:Uncharacterized protein n=1 Tax=Aureliella helgolandensis TaxID=2527968 RepID=A0A518GEE1_9BACT|nr:GlsB/YeaQ/YmgE family stress response membrane protein [Aureliella helgolandensis]QDV26952.1 hypothetical protein Q31a_53320 [Aureliella helgolandensis]QDV26974.1 hypothetical protein Q31a_53540 [Aureliella helgolandensis]